MEMVKRGRYVIAGLSIFLLVAVTMITSLAKDEGLVSSGMIVDEHIVAKGNVTDSVTWKITEDEWEEQTLIIGGSGPMADYSGNTEQPWAEWRKNIRNLVIEDGVTRIGNYSMNGMNLNEVTFGKDVETIGQHSFAYGYGLESIRIPGHVKTIEASAFLFHYTLHSVILEEGVEVLENSAFGSQASSGDEFYIPASLKKFGEMAVWISTGYVVAEENPYFAAKDGVLYNKDMTALVDYPNKKSAKEFRIPDYVSEIKAGAFQRMQGTGKIYIPSSVQKMQSSYLFQYSNIEEVYVDDGVPFSCTGTFWGCNRLVKVRLPENIAIDRMDNFVHYGCNMLESLTIPNGIQNIGYIGSPLKALNSIRYNAERAVIKDSVLLDTEITYELIIGEDVDYLPKSFCHLSQQAEILAFEKMNTFIVDTGVFEGKESPFHRLEGKVHVDEQGVLYICMEEESTARVLYCPPNVEYVYIPAQIRCEDGIEYSVTIIGQDAFKYAKNLQSITFENAEQVKEIEAYGFANCTALKQINMMDRLEEAKALFSGAINKIGYRAFYNTGLVAEDINEDAVEDMAGLGELFLKGEDGKSDLILSAQSEGSTMEWVENGDNTGCYQLLTGDSLTILAAAGNKEAEENQRYRVYFQWMEPGIRLSVTAGQSYQFDDQKVICHGTEDPNCVYVEFTPMIGKTLSIPITAVYPSPSSEGGRLTVWAVALNKEESEEQKEQILLSKTGALRAEWKTIRDEFTLSMTDSGEKEISLQGGQKNRVTMNRDLKWKQVLMRAADVVSAYGKDYVKCVLYEEVLTLPTGLAWKDEVKEAVKTGDIRPSGSNLYAGDILVCNVSVGGGQLNLTDLKLKPEDGTDRIILSYKVTNTVRNAEMNTNTITSIFYKEAFYVGASEFDKAEKKEILNTTTAAINYRYAVTERITASATKTVKIDPGILKLSKSTKVKPYYFGEPVGYEIKLSNPGALPYVADSTGSWMIQETLSPYMYLEPDKMEELFQQVYGSSLTIEITNWEPVEWKDRQGIFENRIYWQNGYNSGVNLRETATESLTIQLNSEGTGFIVEKGNEIYYCSALSDCLKQIGFVPGRWTEYSLSWILNEEAEAFTLEPGESKNISIVGKSKDTFQMMTEDWPGSYPTDAALTLKSTVVLMDEHNKVHGSASVSDKVIREAYIEKRASTDQSELKDSFTVEDGECITYTLEFKHYGDGRYENLPMIDEMYGAQALLVPVSENTAMESLQLEILESKGKEYYVLTEGTYYNVVVGGRLNEENYIASVIKVEEVLEETGIELGEETYSYQGLHTRIEWDWHEMPSGRYRLLLSYDAIVRQEFAKNNVYSIGNLVHMNDRENSRIYAVIWGGGTIIDFRKEIIENKGNTWKEDVADEDDYSLLNAGDSVIYRMTLRNKGKGHYTVLGSDLADQLPDNGKVFSWNKNQNVSLYYESTHDSTTVTNMDLWRIEDSWNGNSKEGQQYILWTDETRIEFQEPNAKVYIYVTLSYPDNKGDESEWYEFVQSLQGSILENTFFVYQFPVNVVHHLNEPGHVLIQKGVYGTSYIKGGWYQETKSRINYNNKDSQNRQVIYYVFLHNAGAKKWYLNDLYDCLPEGFTFQKFIIDSDLNKSGQEYKITTKTEWTNNVLLETTYGNDAEEIRYKSASVQWKEDGTGRLRFQIGAGNGNQAIEYDADREQYYLNQNEAVLFGYICDTGIAEDTKDTATNTLFMYYEDYPKTGLQSMEDYPIRVAAVRTDIYGEKNDGVCNRINGTEIYNQYQIIHGDLQDYWLSSDVTVVRGEIIPGITKYTESYVAPGNSIVTEYTNAAGPFDQINWRIRLHNSGTLALTDYTVQDILPDSYVLCDTVRYELFDYLGNQIQSYKILNVTERTEDSITIITDNSKKKVSLNGEETSIKISNNNNSNSKTGSLSISTSDKGNEVLTIHFSDYTVSIPEGGYMDLYLSANNPTTQYKNTVYTNQAVIKPNKQTFYGAGQGSVMKDDQDRSVAVKNSSPVTISFGYATGSQKAVREKTNSTNRAESTDMEKNYILLEDEKQSFVYELAVTNDTDRPMEKLVFIDNLPEQGDTSPFDSSIERQSQFDVALDEDTDVRVLIKDGENSYELEKGTYSVGFSEKTVFTEEDWKGISAWNGEKKDARSIRILIQDSEGMIIPAGAKITVMFSCHVKEETIGEGTVIAGKVAWNSFGYHYKLLGVEQELEAMPMCVGVKLADIPKLEKHVTDEKGAPYILEADKEFCFLVYEGTSVEGNLTEEEKGKIEIWTSVLEEKNRDYMIQSVLVEAGKSKSETVHLEDLEWKEGQTYTIYEFQNQDEFRIKGVNGLDGHSFTFQYNKDRDMVLKVRNIWNEWSLEILKTDEDGKIPLEGAVFALYSPKDNGSSSVLDENGNLSKVPDILERNGQNWYLYDVKTTDREGKLYFDMLREENYYLQEIEAPDGYERQEEGMIVYSKNAENGILRLEIRNKRGMELPETGGPGAGMFIAVGTALAILSCRMRHDKKVNKSSKNKQRN